MAIKNISCPNRWTKRPLCWPKYGVSLLVMAGGTIAMPLINEGISIPEKVMGLRRAGLNYVRQTMARWLLARPPRLTQVLDVGRHSACCNKPRAQCRRLDSSQYGHGGRQSLCPAAGRATLAVALLALDARLKAGQPELANASFPLAEFYTGFMTNALQPGELLAEIQVPIPQGKTAYIKYGRKHANTPVGGHRCRPRCLSTAQQVERRPHRPQWRRAAPHPGHAGRGSHWSARRLNEAPSPPRSGGRRGMRPFHRCPGQRMVPAQDGRACTSAAPWLRLLEGRDNDGFENRSFTLNGREIEVLVKQPLITLQTLLREQLGYTATKAGCRQGGCGSCTVLVNGEPMAVLPAARPRTWPDRR